MSTDIHVVAVVEGKPGSAKAIVVVVVVAPCIAATRREQGCRSYTFHQDKERPDRFMFIETWASEDALGAWDAFLNMSQLNGHAYLACCLVISIQRGVLF